MNRNVESHFSELPSAQIERSIFDRSCSHKTSFNVGDLIPFYVDEVLPGDTFNITTSAVMRLQTPITPIMDNMYCDTYYFFVPNRLTYVNWKQFCGENSSSAWTPQLVYSLPRIVPPQNGWNVGTIADYMGIPVGAESNNTNRDYPLALPFRAYALICQEWFRDQNLTDPLVIPTDMNNVTGSNGNNYRTDVAKGGLPFKVAKYHDYFTSCLPSPQKGPNIGLWSNNLADNSFKKLVPVVTDNTRNSASSMNGNFQLWDLSTNPKTYNVLISDGTEAPYDLKYGYSGDGIKTFAPANLWANVGAMSLSINELRLAFQMQKFLEKNARSGTRYREILKAHFGVTSPDARMMIPEYLGGHRFPLSIHQVANQSQGESDFLGDLGAMSNTSDVHEDFVKSFTEHGFIIGVCCVRYDHSYSQGMERFWNRKDYFDYYWPVFANIGEQPVFKREIYWNSSLDKDEVFGYQEAWADYRYKPSRVSGEMRPGVSNSLAIWHLSDYYNAEPSLSDDWIREDKSNVDRVLQVTSAVANQIFCDFYIKNICTRPMPMFSVPGLIDHH